MRRVSSEEEGMVVDGYSVSSIEDFEVGQGEREVSEVGGVIGMGMLAAVSCRSEKSVGRRPRGREGG